MTLILMIVEATSLFAAVNGAALLSASHLASSWTDVFIVLGKALTISACYIAAFYYNDLYDLGIVRTFGDFAARLPQAFGVAFLFLAALYALIPESKLSNAPFFLSIPMILALLLPLRAICYLVRRRKPFQERVLILGTTPLAYTLIKELEARPYLGWTIFNVVDSASASMELPSAQPLLGPLDRLGKILEEIQPHRVIIAVAERRTRLPVRDLLDARLRGCVIEDGVNVYERFMGKLAIEALTPSHLFLGDFKKSRLDLAIGRGLSLLAAVVGTIALSPLLGFVALLIKIDSAGPVFFVQERVGMEAKRFKVVKFRTMRLAEAPTSDWECDNVQRITRVGKWLRKFRLDELPQFFNVIRGDMNLVGPRPHPVSNFELFTAAIPYYSLRSAVRPGITGWAQVRLGYANNLEEETEKMRYDLYYIKHLSVWLDVRILFDTVKIVLFGRGSQPVERYRPEAAIVTGGR